MTADELRLLSFLLDQGMALPVAEREPWLGTLDGEAAKFATTLRELLAKQASQETGDLVDRAPAFFAPKGEPGAGDTVGPYCLLSELGHGGMGAVWLAERVDGSPKRKVALKLPYLGWAPGLAARFARESHILAGLEHPHIARLYDAGLDDRGRPYMALEYVEGESLDAYCRARSLPIKARLELLLQVAEAVAFAHSRLIVHRDLKPSNILVTAQGQVRLLDFGVAKLMEGDHAVETQLTQLSGRAMTLDYASPEQILGEPIGTSSDVYSLGVVAYELLAGARPYRLKRGNAAELEEAIARIDAPAASATSTDPDIRRGLKGDLDAILNKALKKTPAERYATVDAFALDLRRYLRHEPVSARPDALGYLLAKLVRRYRVQVAAGALAAGALAAGAVIALWQAHRAETEARTAQAVESFLSDIFKSSSGEQKAPAAARNRTALQLLDAGAARVDVALAGAPKARARVLGTLARIYGDLARWDLAVEMQRRRTAALREIHRGDHRELAEALTFLGNLLFNNSDNEAAQAAFAEALAILDRLGDHGSFERGLAESARAWELMEKMAPKEAVEAAGRAVTILRLHPPSPDLVQALSTFASAIRQAEGSATEARVALEEALVVSERLGGRGEAMLGDVLLELAKQQKSGGQYSEAQRTLQRAYAQANRREGPDSIEAIGIGLNLGRLFLEQGEFLKALEALNDIAPAASRRLAEGSSDWYVEAALAFRAAAQAESGALEEGIAGLRQALERKRGLAAQPLVYVPVLAQLASALRQQGDFRAASEALDAAESLWANQSMQRRAPLHEARLRLSVAQNDLQAMQRGLRQLEGARKGREAPTMESLPQYVLEGEVRLALGDVSKALAMAQQAIALLESDPGVRAWRRELEFQAARTAGMAQLSLAKPTEARDLLQRALDASTGRLDPEASPRVAELLELQARSEAALGERAKADTLLARARSIRARRS